MTRPTTIVLFRANEDHGVPALTFEVVEQDESTVTYVVTFEKKTPPQGPAEANPPAMGDLRISPDQVDAMSDSGEADLPAVA